MEQQQTYIKATLENGVSRTSPTITYKIGRILHPNPDMESKDSCGVGIHLAKTLKAANKYVPGAKEYYYAIPGAILGEDEDKVRCASCRIIKRLTSLDIAQLQKQEQSREEKLKKELEMREQYGRVFDTGGLPGKDWFTQHCGDVSIDDINNQTLEIYRGDKRVLVIKPRMKRKDARYVIKSALA